MMIKAEMDVIKEMKTILGKIMIIGICIFFIVLGAVSSSGGNIPAKKLPSILEYKLKNISDTPTYIVTDLGTLGGSGANALSISQNGLIAGGADAIEAWWPDDLRHAFLWNSGSMKDLGTLGHGAISEGWGVNDLGQVVGISEVERFTAEFIAFFWDGNQMINLGTLGGHESGAYAINNRGQIIGSSDTASSEHHATLWYQNSIRDLGTLGGAFSYAWDINEQGQVVGKSWIERPAGEHAFLWLPIPAYGLSAGMHDLGTLGGTSEAWGINDHGQVVGTAQCSYEFRQHAFLWENGRMIDLTGNSNANVTIAWDINNHGQIVGVEMFSVPDEDYPYRATLWQNHNTIDLNTCIPRDSGWYLLNANGINDAGQIVGYGVHRGYSSARAFLLTPTK